MQNEISFIRIHFIAYCELYLINIKFYITIHNEIILKNLLIKQDNILISSNYFFIPSDFSHL